jgi:hypothetical protein
MDSRCQHAILSLGTTVLSLPLWSTWLCWTPHSTHSHRKRALSFVF